MASASMVISTMFPTTIPPFQGRHSTSVGESNAVFLRGVGGDAATEPHKTRCSGYPEEEFSGTHKLVYKNHGVLSRRELSVKLPKLARKTFIR